MFRAGVGSGEARTLRQGSAGEKELGREVEKPPPMCTSIQRLRLRTICMAQSS